MGQDRYQNVMVGSGEGGKYLAWHLAQSGQPTVVQKEEMDMARLSAVTKNKITKVLDATYFTQHGFTVKYDDENNPMVTIAFSACPEYQFVINSIHNVNVFTTSECPGIHLDAAETFQRSNFELCIDAIKEWTERIIDRQKNSIIDEFGGEGG